MGKNKGSWFAFDYFIVPVILKVLHVVFAVAALASGIAGTILFWADLDWRMRIAAMVVTILSPFFIRILFEILIVFFRVAEDIHAIRNNCGQENATFPAGELPKEEQVSPEPPRPVESVPQRQPEPPRSMATPAEQDARRIEAQRLEDLFNAPPVRKQD